jgi:hypothetical protein
MVQTFTCQTMELKRLRQLLDLLNKLSGIENILSDLTEDFVITCNQEKTSQGGESLILIQKEIDKSSTLRELLVNKINTFVEEYGDGLEHYYFIDGQLIRINNFSLDQFSLAELLTYTEVLE